MIEIIGVSVYEVRDYAGKKCVADFAFRLIHEKWTIEKIEEHLLWSYSFEISDKDLFQ